MYDLIIRETEIFDGTGAASRRGDVAIEGNKIVAVGTPAQSAREIVDGTNLALAPGFIDVHTHDDFAVILHPDMAFKTLGGVTTVVVGNCGFGPAPWKPASRFAATIDPRPLPQWEGFRGYMQTLEANPPAVNVATLIGHGTARHAVMGLDNREPTGAEMDAMKEIVTEGLEAGCVGMSSGLIYDPGRHARTDELVELASLMRGTGALYATHMRDEGMGLLSSVAEAIEIGDRAGVPVQISHHKASGERAWGLVTQSLKLIEDAQAKGQNVHADQYPYTAGSTTLGAVFRDGAFGGPGRETAPKNIVIASAQSHSEWEGRSIEDIATAMGCSAPQAATQVLKQAPGATIIIHMMREEDVRTVMRHKSTMIGSDGIPTLDGKPHPRLYNTFARVLGHYARDEKLFPMEEAIHRMTGFSAKKFGMQDRGVIAPGKAADLVLFDPKKIIDTGTFEDPKKTPLGIKAVYTNGKLTAQDGKATPARAGRVLRRAGSS
ncbi:MAG: N-acyl-D-amino-acid deacylase family protein [Micropepsaceae bacterium]